MSFWNNEIDKRSFFKRLFFKQKKRAKLATPAFISENCSGLPLGDWNIKSIIFSTDVALIENNDSDAVLAVYPFPPSRKIMETLILFSNKPVICGIGGGITKGKNALEMAITAEELGAAAVIVNQPFNNRDIKKIRQKISIPIISSISTMGFDFQKRIDAGVSIFHITGGKNTQAIIRYLHENFSSIPLICTAGKTIDNLNAVLEENVHAVVLTPPSNGDLFKNIMQNYRSGINKIKRPVA